MRIVLLTALAVLALATRDAHAFPRVGPRTPLIVKDIKHPDTALAYALEHLKRRVLIEDRPFFRFFWAGATPDARLIHDVTTWRAYLQTVSSEVNIVRPFDVPGTGFLLWGVDIRDLRWTIAGFSAVARRDRVFTEPNCDHQLAEAIRREIGVKQDPETFHVEAVVPMAWFLRQVMDPDGTQSTTYYDLLYSEERFGADKDIRLPGRALVETAGVIPPEPQKPLPRPWKGGVWPDDGKEYAKGSFPWIPKEELDRWEKDHAEWQRLQKSSLARPRETKEIVGIGEAVVAKVVKDFPADLKDFQDRWGFAANAAFLDKQRIFVNNGEVVAGSKSDPRRGSYVSYQDRVIRFADGQFNNGAMNMSTQDFLRTSRQKNPANLPKETALGLLEEDAGEHLFGMPNGFPASLLTGPAKDGRKRVEFGDARLVHSSLDPRDVTVRTQFSCVICHGVQDGILAPSNRKYGETLGRGIENFIKGKQNQLVVKNFFLDWDWKLELGRAAYRRGLARATEWGGVPPWNGQQWSEATISFRDWYDDPVTLDQAAAELGYPRLVVMIACLSEGSIDAGNLFMEEPIPRTVWDDDLFPNLSLLIAATANFEDPDPLLQLFAGDLIHEAKTKLFGKGAPK